MWHSAPKNDAWREVHLAHVESLGSKLWLRCNVCGHSMTPEPGAFAHLHHLDMETPRPPLLKKERPMRSSSLLMIAAIAAVTMMASVVTSVAQGDTPNLVGVWTGRVEAGVSQGIQEHEAKVVEPTFGNYELTMTLTISRQEGRALVGIWSSPDHREKIFGVLRQDNKNLIMVDEDSHFSGLLLSPSSMELCLSETHQHAMGAWCLLMEKQVQKAQVHPLQ